jgi:hypothetical protein
VKSVLVAALLSLPVSGAWANLITNGTFDSDLSGWSQAVSGTGVTWDSGTAHIGRPGPNGSATLFQSFDISATAALLQIAFDYQWQINRPQTPDFFTAEFEYQSTGGAVVTPLVANESSATAPFNSTISFLTTVALSNIAPGPDNGTLRFTLVEQNNAVGGTRIQLDNVAASTVPQPASLLLLALGLLILGGYDRVVRTAQHA